MLTQTENLNELKAFETFMDQMEADTESDGIWNKEMVLETPDLELQLKYLHPLYPLDPSYRLERMSLNYPTLTLQTWGTDIKQFEVIEWMVGLAESLVSEITNNDVSAWTAGFSAEWSETDDEDENKSGLVFTFSVTVTDYLS